MECRLVDLRCKEVINVCDGQRLGFVTDVVVRMPDGQIVALVVPGPVRMLGLLGCKEEYVIPWNCIKRVGEDIVLVDIDTGKCCAPKHRRGLGRP